MRLRVLKRTSKHDFLGSFHTQCIEKRRPTTEKFHSRKENVSFTFLSYKITNHQLNECHVD